jgi:hypothetical protein
MRLPRSAARRFGWAGILVAVLAMVVLAPGRSLPGEASSHRDAPLIIEDPTADNTDVYAFVSTEPNRSDHVTVIANFIPLEEPGEGPNYYRLSDNVLYEVKLDVTGDGNPELVYQFDFTTTTANGNTFLYNTGVIQPVGNPADVTAQYPGLNVQQRYTLTEVRPSGGGPMTLLTNARIAPIRVGPKSLLGTATGDTSAAYTVLANQAIHSVGTAPNDIKVFVGPRAEGFYVDLMGAFDLINPRNPGVNYTAGYNVHTFALEIPKSRLATVGGAGVVGVWASASRQATRVLQDGQGAEMLSGAQVQVSRLANPLVNEVLMPLNAKDRYNFTQPSGDTTIRDFIVNPGTSQGPAALIPVINSITGCTPTTGRADLELALLKGIDPATAGALAMRVPSLAPFAMAGGNQIGMTPAVADMIRLNYNVAPSASPNVFGLLGGDPAGFPNGRRVFDDVTDIDLKAAAGAILHVLGAINCPASLTLTDNVDAFTIPPAHRFLGAFPYLGLPYDGYTEGGPQVDQSPACQRSCGAPPPAVVPPTVVPPR